MQWYKLGIKCRSGHAAMVSRLPIGTVETDTRAHTKKTVNAFHTLSGVVKAHLLSLHKTRHKNKMSFRSLARRCVGTSAKWMQMHIIQKKQHTHAKAICLCWSQYRFVSYKICKLAYTSVITESLCISLSHSLSVFRSHSLVHTHLRAFGGLSDVWHSTLAPPPPSLSASLGPDSAFNAEGKNIPPLLILSPHLSLLFPLTLDFFSSSSLPPAPVPQLCLGLLSLLLLPGPHLIIQSLMSLLSFTYQFMCTLWHSVTPIIKPQTLLPELKKMKSSCN